VRKEAGKCNKVPVLVCPFEEKKGKKGLKFDGSWS
jgi:hypothetical protein